MARIIYAVAGEGFGHSSRSHLIGQRLIEAGHDLLFVGSRKSLVYLKEHFGDRVREIFGLSFAYDGSRIDKSQTLKQNLQRLPEANRLNDALFKQHFEPFGPDLVMSDFEPFSAWWAWRKGIPFLSIDHEHVLTLCKLDHPSGSWFSRITAQAITECHYVGALAYIIINFFRAPLRIDTAVLAPPIVRPVVMSLQPTVADHILVYSTTGQNEAQLLRVLRQFPSERFCIYGFDRDNQQGNCIFKRRSTEQFLKDLAAARGVIASAGFSLLSECMYFKKKMLLVPIAGQYEQMINAHYVQRLGLGISTEELTGSVLRKFLEEVDQPMPEDDRILWPDNGRFFEILQNVLSSVDPPISLSLAH